MHILSVSGLVAALSLVPAIAFAGSCFEDLGKTGCTDQETFPKSDLERLSCENLWLVRNRIFADNGYCFKTARGKEHFDNATCSVDDANLVKLNSHERANVATIRAVERDMGCE
jgi:hypothetical protein